LDFAAGECGSTARQFVSETERGKEREQAIIREIKMVQDSIGNVLDRMLFLLAREYIDEDSLCCTLAKIFQRLLKSEGAHDELTCDNIITGFAKLGVTFAATQQDFTSLASLK
jgi:hypothetical protein